MVYYILIQPEPTSTVNNLTIADYIRSAINRHSEANQHLPNLTNTLVGFISITDVSALKQLKLTSEDTIRICMLTIGLRSSNTLDFNNIERTYEIFQHIKLTKATISPIIVYV